MRRSSGAGAGACAGIGLLLGLVCAAPGPASAQAYPSRPVRLIIDFPAGGPSDTLARVVGQKLTEALGQQFVFDNRPGVNGVIAYSLAAKAPADGHTLVILSTPFPLNAVLRRNLTYDTLKDFAPVSLIANYANLLVVHPSVPARTMQEFVAFGKAKPGGMRYASSGAGSVQHLAMELLRSLAGFEAVHVPYAGSAPALLDVVGGRVEAVITLIPTAIPHIKAGRIRPLGVLGDVRSKTLPEIPTLVESGYRVVANGWGGIGAPAGVPRAVVERLNAEIVRAVADPGVAERLAAVGGDPHTSTPDEFARFIRAEVERWGPVVKQSGATLD